MRRIILTAIPVFFLGSCTQGPEEQPQEDTVIMKYAMDPHSFSRPNEAVVKHLDLDIEVDFQNRVIQGVANWEIETQGSPDSIHFDTEDLTILEVMVDGEKADYSLGSKDPVLGQDLRIPISEKAKVVSITYSTSPDAAALQWLGPEQTHDKNLPFLFTQSQAILARTWIPCQDSPGIRFTYNAHVHVPEAMIALMSANNPQERNVEGQYSFTMDIPIPSYLMALTVGDVAFAPEGSRTGIYAEPGQLEAARDEFVDMEKMVEAAEGLYGPYVWGRYDMIILPPSFPFGGMENPKLTFATPTIIAGDRSLVSLVAHELAHSWSGNLVTNATWNDFWLNEGFTVYFEQRIMEKVYGRDYSEMLASLSYDGLLEEIEDMKSKGKEKDTHLKLDLRDRDPDDGMNSIAYDKGYLLLRLLEETVGREEWDSFLREYFETYKFQSMDTERFLSLLKDSLLSEKQIADVDLHAWVYGAGLPANAPHPQSDRFQRVEKVLTTFVENGSLPPADTTDLWTTHEWLHFINRIPKDVTLEQLTALDKAYGFTNSGNAEILAAWFQPTIRHHYMPIYPAVEDFLIHVGRRKFLTPTYRAMKESEQLDRAREIYSKARPNYHSVSQQTMDDLLGVEG